MDEPDSRTLNRVWTPLLLLGMAVLLAFGSAFTGIYIAKLAQPEFTVAAQDWSDSEDASDAGSLDRPSPLGPKIQ